MAPLIELEHLFDALKGFARPLREGRLAVDNIVEPVGVRPPRINRFVDVEALVIRTTKINEPAVLVKVEIDKDASDVPSRIKTISCECPAGACKQHCCKHAMAVLIYLQKNDESTLEQLTCTDVQQIWGSVSDKTLSRFCPIPVDQFCHIKKKPKVYKRAVLDVTPELEQEFRALFIAAQPTSEAAIFLSGARQRSLPSQDVPEISHSNEYISIIMEHALRNESYILKKAAELSEQLYGECTPEQQDFYNKYIRVTDDEAKRMCADTVGQDNDLWKLFKYGRFTGSIIYSMYTYSKNKAPNWAKKFTSTFKSTFKGNENTDIGLMYEDDARDCYSLKHNTYVATAGIIVSPLVPWLGFSPDGVIIVDKKPVSLWENKTPVKGDKVDGKNIASIHGSICKKKVGKLKEKHPYYGQVQLGMLLTGLSSCEFTLYCHGFSDDADLSKRMYVDTVMIDEQFLLDMVDRTCRVFFKFLLPWLVSQQ